MDKFLEMPITQNNSRRIRKISMTETAKEIESGIKTSPQRKVEDQMASPVNCTKHLKNWHQLYFQTLPEC